MNCRYCHAEKPFATYLHNPSASGWVCLDNISLCPTCAQARGVILRLRRDKARLMKFIRKATTGAYGWYGEAERAFKNDQIWKVMK